MAELTKSKLNPDTNKLAVSNDEEKPCLDVINEAVSAEPGIVRVKLDPQQQQITFDYNPDIIAGPAVDQIAQRISPPLQHNLETCVMRLEPRGGRACESCALVLENRLSRIQGVRRATASYMGGALSVTYDQSLVSPDQLKAKITQLGVSVAPSSAELPALAEPAAPAQAPLQQAWTWLSRQNLEAIFTVITLITMVLGWLTAHFGGSPLVSTIFYVIAYATGGTFGLKGGIESLRQQTIDVDLLMVLAALGAAIVGSPFEGALLLFLFSLSNVLQAYAMDRTRNAIRALMKLRPNQAQVRRGEKLVTLPVEKIVVGDRYVVRPGDRIPLDGVVIAGESMVDQASITGESMPVAKGPGQPVLAGTINQNGSLEAEVTRLAKDSTLAKLIKLVEEAQSEKAHTQRFLDKAEQYYAMGVIVFTILVAAVPIFFLGEAFNTAFYRAMTVMVAASPCALIISTPASILSAIGNGARKGVLFKGGVYMEQAAGIKVVAFDKTGTLTQGKPEVTDVLVIEAESKAEAQKRNSTLDALRPTLWQGNADELLALAAAVEAKSEHPLAQAVVEAARRRKLEIAEVQSFQAATGKGARGLVNGLDIRVGNQRYFEAFETVGSTEVTAALEQLQADGKTAIIVAQMADEGQTAHFLGVIALADTVRPDAAPVVAELKSLGVQRVVMLTGDNERVAHAIATQTGVDEYFAELLPEDKVRIVKELEANYGAVAMIGDGVNDAPALASASIGVAMGAAGTDVALETADVVLMADDLSNIPYLIALSRQTRKTLIINLGFAMAAIAVMIAAIFIANMPLPLAVIGHEGGTVLVSLNGLRLLLYRRSRRKAG
ncbi:MAG: heavy metal translocating P-type ATPase [Anaerolineales bacterium]|nr:heavy metal translocating P-type ATPase [Anaerolineales bacterium]